MTPRGLFSGGAQAALFCSGLLLAAAGVAQTTTHQEQPKPGVATAAPKGLPTARGGDPATAAVFEKTCSGCHDLSQAVAQPMDRAGWSDTIARMIGYGAPLSAAQADQMADYLAATHGTAAPAGK